VAVDANGNLFIADSSYVRKVDTNGLITTVAGNGASGYSGDGGAATNASMKNPQGVALDALGNLFIADENNQRIRKVDTNGLITTVAGNGSYGYSGDGGAATNASLYYPAGTALDALGNLFIADEDNQRIRKVDTNGIITTVAGNGSYGYSGDGGAATNASLRDPVGVAVDAYGNLFIADSFYVRKVDTNGLITTVAGNGVQTYSGDGGAATNASLWYPESVAVDASGNLFIADRLNSRIRMVNAGGLITTVAGNGSYGYSGDGGAATNASLNYPDGVAVAASGDLFIADSFNGRVREVIPDSGPLTLALNGVTLNNAGNYQLIITNACGSVTSSIVTVTVTLPQIAASPNANGSVTLNLLTAPNVSSEVLAATNLTPPVVWQSLSTFVPGTNGVWQFTDTNASQYPVRFYRSSTP
jgi:sugar lactone lactonase YvrE